MYRTLKKHVACDNLPILLKIELYSLHFFPPPPSFLHTRTLKPQYLVSLTNANQSPINLLLVGYEYSKGYMLYALLPNISLIIYIDTIFYFNSRWILQSKNSDLSTHYYTRIFWQRTESHPDHSTSTDLSISKLINDCTCNIMYAFWSSFNLRFKPCMTYCT